MINEGNKMVPHGNIDFLVTGVTLNAPVGVVMINGTSESLMIAGSAKTEVSIGKNESGMIMIVSWCL